MQIPCIFSENYGNIIFYILGPNKVYACMIALKFSEKWHALQPNDRETFGVLKKSKELFQRAAIEKIIYHNNLSSDISLSYIQNPVQLIEYFIEEFSSSSESSIKGKITSYLSYCLYFK